MRLNLLITIFLFNILYSQEDNSLNYKEDQIYLNFNFDFQLKSIEGYQQNGFSRSFNLGILKDISFNEKGNKGIAFGLGYGGEFKNGTLFKIQASKSGDASGVGLTISF